MFYFHFPASCLPWVPEKGTVGASGDLAPLAHLALGMMGEGKMWSPECGWGEARYVRCILYLKMHVYDCQLFYIAQKKWRSRSTLCVILWPHRFWKHMD